MKVTAHEGGINIFTYKYKPYREATSVKDKKYGRRHRGNVGIQPE